MANRIRGITVEIGGDVTKLDKALEGTNKQLSKTQRNLKDIEKALKIDPTNTVLLEQKQRLLAQAVEFTGDRFQKVKQAAESVKPNDVLYEEWQKALSSLQGQITKTTNEMAGLEKKAKELEKLGFAPDSSQVKEVTDKAEAARKKMEELEQQTKDTYEEMGRPVSWEQYDAIQRELVESEDAFKKAEKAANSFNITAAKFSGEADKIADKAGKVADATKGISLAAGGALTALGGLAVKAGMSADDLNTLSKQTGFSTQTLQEWQYASKFVDVSVEDIVGSARKLKQNMDSTSEDVAKAWETLGVSFRDADGFRDVEYVFNAVLIGLSQIQNETERDIVAMTLFGRSADQLAGIIDDGGEALRRFGKEAQEAGLILSQDALDSANKFNDALDELKAKAGGELLQLGTNLAEALLPVLEDLVDAIVPLLDWISQLDQGTLKFILTILTLVASVSPVASAISSIGSTIKYLSTVSGLFSSVAGEKVYLTFVKWSVIIIAIIAAVSLLIALINVLIGKSDDMQSAMKSVGNAAGSISGSGGSISPNIRTATVPSLFPQDYPAFASGGVFAPNSPMLGVLGDHPTEYEVAAPESMLRDTFLDALSSSGLLGRGAAPSGNQPVILNMDGRTFARLFVPYLKAEYNRLGIDLLNR